MLHADDRTPTSPPLRMTNTGWKLCPLHWSISTRRYIAFLMAMQRSGFWTWGTCHVLATRSCQSIMHYSCCPGGFSDYVLRQNPEARGVGLSLGQENGGHGLAIPFPQRARFEIHWADLTYLAICAPQGGRYRLPPGSLALSKMPFTPRGFRLVILDGQHRRPQESSSTHPWDIDRLLIAQLIIGLESLERGGTLVAKLSHLESATTARLVYMLDTLSKRIVLFKPYVHGTRNSFYAVAIGVGRGQQCEKSARYLKNLKKVWWHMTYDGPSNEGRWLKEEDLDFITKFETLHGPYLKRLVKLGKGVWRAQGNALRRTYVLIREAAAQNETGSDNHESDPGGSV
jgi:FtsJ-like methyltransferase